MKTAKLLKILGSTFSIRILYKMDPPLPSYGGKTHQYVILSSVKNEHATECYVFASDEIGTCIDFAHLPGSTTETENQTRALNSLGYSIEV